MVYFDNAFLRYYLNLDTDLKVFVDGGYLDIADAYDIANPNIGIGYTIYGTPVRFDYRDIEHIMFGNRTFTLDQLEKAYAPKDSKDAKEEKPEDEEKPEGEEKPAEKEKKEESVQMHSYVQNIDIGHPKFKTKGSVIALGEGWVTYEYFSSETGKMSTTTVKRKSVKVI